MTWPPTASPVDDGADWSTVRKFFPFCTLPAVPEPMAVDVAAAVPADLAVHVSAHKPIATAPAAASALEFATPRAFDCLPEKAAELFVECASPLVTSTPDELFAATIRDAPPADVTAPIT
jgi:hypothetical protein